MRVLRASLWRTPDRDPVHMILRDSDLKVSIEKALEGAAEPGIYFSHEILTMDDSLGFEQATVRALQSFSRNRQNEANQAMLYYYDAASFLRARGGGVVMATKPAPLNVEEIKDVIRQLWLHPDFKDHRIMVIAKDGTILQASKGEITLHRPDQTQSP